MSEHHAISELRNQGSYASITLFTHGTPNGVKIAIALEEMGLPYKAELVEVFSGDRPEAANSWR